MGGRADHGLPGQLRLRTIQAAINAAASGALLVIGAGTYDGPLTIGTSLTLADAGAAQTTITVPPSGGTAITVDTGVSATVKGVTVSGGSSSYGGGLFNFGPSATLAAARSPATPPAASTLTPGR